VFSKKNDKVKKKIPENAGRKNVHNLRNTEKSAAGLRKRSERYQNIMGESRSRSTEIYNNRQKLSSNKKTSKNSIFSETTKRRENLNNKKIKKAEPKTAVNKNITKRTNIRNAGVRNMNIERDTTGHSYTTMNQLRESQKIARTSYIKIKRNKRRNQRNSKIFSITLFIMIILYLGGYTFKFITKEKISFDTIQYGSIDTPKLAEGIIIRNEKIYNATRDGVVNYNAADGEKIKKNSVICSIKDEDVVSTMEEGLEDINKSILHMQENREDISLFAEDVKRINKQIKKSADNNAYDFVKLNISGIYAFKNDIQNKIDVRNQILLSENKGSLQELANKKIEQENRISQNIDNISAQEGGIVSYTIDGMEDAYTPEMMQTLTKEQTLMKPKNVTDIKNQVSKDEPLFKIINSNQWYIVSYIQNKYIENWQEEDTFNIYIIKSDSENIPLEVSVERLQSFEKESFVILRITKNIDDYKNTRNISFQIEKSRKGYKIANNSIVEQTLIKIPAEFVNEEMVQKVTEKGVELIPITISAVNDEENMVLTPVDFETINIGDVIQNPDDSTKTYTLSEVENTKGIFIINTGIAEFYKINMENSVSNSTHTIIDPKLNTNINIYDRIVTDTKNIEKKQMVY